MERDQLQFLEFFPTVYGRQYENLPKKPIMAEYDPLKLLLLGLYYTL